MYTYIDTIAVLMLTKRYISDLIVMMAIKLLKLNVI